MRITILVAALLAVLVPTTAHAHRSHWQGFAMSHQYYDGPYYVVPGDYGPGGAWAAGAPPTQQEIDKAVADEKACEPVVLYGDQVVVHPALGCRK